LQPERSTERSHGDQVEYRQKEASMNLKNQPPIFVPEIYWPEIERLPKAALMDMVWDLAQRCAGVDDNHPRQIIEEVTRTADIITAHRKHEHKPWRERIYGPTTER
jgi:hypothetical protein